LPKTRSGNIIRCWLKELVTTFDISGSITTPEDMSVAEISGTYFRNPPPNDINTIYLSPRRRCFRLPP
jgi:hypothetical protein